jgi:hypothetical protein
MQQYTTGLQLGVALAKILGIKNAERIVIVADDAAKTIADVVQAVAGVIVSDDGDITIIPVMTDDHRRIDTTNFDSR